MATTTNEFAKGWPVLLASFIGIGVGITSLAYYSNGVWVIPWQEEFGWSRAQIGLGQGLAALVLVVGSPFAGSMIDKYGLRNLAALSLLLYGIGYFLFSYMNGPIWVYYLIALMFAFSALLTTPLGFTRSINAWFHKNRGLALGLGMTSTGLGGFLVPRYLTPYVAENGWRSGYVAMFIIVMIAVPLVWLLLKKEVPPAEEATEEDKERMLTGITLKEAVKQPVFWMIAAIFILIAVAILGLIPSFIPLLQDAGMTPAKAGQLAGVLGLSVMAGRILTGFLIDRFFAPRVITAVFTLVAAGLLALTMGGSDYSLFSAVALGFAVGAEVDLIGYLSVRYFGLKHYGAIYGTYYSMFNFGAVVSPPAAGYIWDKTGDYNLALTIAIVLIIMAVVISLFMPKFPDSTAAH